jgi:hypothetical protein
LVRGLILPIYRMVFLPNSFLDGISKCQHGD